VGDPGVDSEEMLSYELGYRIEPNPRLSFDLAMFFNDYELLAPFSTDGMEMDPVMHLVQSYGYKNDVLAHTYGAELLVQWRPTDYWRLSAAYSWLRGEFDVKPNHGNPEHQFNLRSSLDLGRGLEFHSIGYFVDRIDVLPQGEAIHAPIDS